MWRGFDDSPRPWLARSLSGSATSPSQKRATAGERGSALRPNLLRHVNFPPGGSGPKIAEIFRTFPGEGVRLATLWQDLELRLRRRGSSEIWIRGAAGSSVAVSVSTGTGV